MLAARGAAWQAQAAPRTCPLITNAAPPDQVGSAQRIATMQMKEADSGKRGKRRGGGDIEDEGRRGFQASGGGGGGGKKSRR